MKRSPEVRRSSSVLGPSVLGSAALAAMLLLAACDNDIDTDPPATLVEIKPRVKIDRLWSTGLHGEERLRLGLVPATDGERIYAADHGGDIYAFDINKGREIWRARTKLPLSGGPAVGNGHLVLGSSEGDVIAVQAANGAEVWRKKLNGEVLAPPAVGVKVVVVRTVDGHLHGLDIADGSELWVADQNVPKLSLRGTAPPVIVGDLVVDGFDNGKVMAANLADGAVVWETAVTPSHGRTEIERLVDIDSAARVVDKDVFVVGFQGRAAMLALESGQIWWARDLSSERGLAVGESALYVSNSDGHVVALRRRDGSLIWEQKLLHRRGLTAPTLDGPTLVVADFEGYVHWIDAATGELLATLRTDKNRVTNPPLVVDDKVFVLTDKGTLTAFKRGQRLEVTDADRAAEDRARAKAAEELKKDIEKAEKKRAEKANKKSASPPER